MAVMNWLPRGSGGGTGNKMNIFVQPTEPDIKEGIWIETDKDISGILITDDFGVDGAFTELQRIPYKFNFAGVSASDDSVFLFGTTVTGLEKNCYKYNTINNTYMKMRDIPYTFAYSWTISVGSNSIYLFGGLSVLTNCYRYNVLTDTYTKLVDTPYGVRGSGLAEVDSKIYIFGGGSGTTNWKSCYRYNISTNSFTKMLDIPYDFYHSTTASVGTDIILFGTAFSSTRKNCYKYNTINNTYTKLADMPYDFYEGSTINVDDIVYIFGGGGLSDRKNCYKYDIRNNTFIRLDDIPYDFHTGGADKVGTDVYLFGTDSIGYEDFCYKFDTVTGKFDEGTFIIKRSDEYDGLYKTQFFQPPGDINPDYMGRIVSGFDDALLYADDTMQDSLPTYYGNGTEWIKFKN